MVGHFDSSADRVAREAAGRIVLLGASNVSRGLRVALSAACKGRRQPLDILAAIGHGRSYGAASCVLGGLCPASRNVACGEHLRSELLPPHWPW